MSAKMLYAADVSRRGALAGWRSAVGLVAGVLALIATCGGCTAESTRIALQAQQRAAEVDEAVFERQHDGLKVLLFRDTLQRMSAQSGPEGAGIDTALLADTLNRAWNERDLIEFWAMQHERAKALRLIGVDAKLFSEQSIIDLLIKSVTAKADRAKQGIVAAQAARLTPPTESAAPPAEQPTDDEPRAEESASSAPTPSAAKEIERSASPSDGAAAPARRGGVDE